MIPESHPGPSTCSLSTAPGSHLHPVRFGPCPWQSCRCSGHTLPSQTRVLGFRASWPHFPAADSRPLSVTLRCPRWTAPGFCQPCLRAGTPGQIPRAQSWGGRGLERECCPGQREPLRLKHPNHQRLGGPGKWGSAVGGTHGRVSWGGGGAVWGMVRTGGGGPHQRAEQCRQNCPGCPLCWAWLWPAFPFWHSPWVDVISSV